MLEQMRQSSGSFVIWVLFAIIIAAFVLFFGSPSDSLGCGSTNTYALEVGGREVSQHSWRFAVNGMTGPASAKKMRAMKMLLEREILAQAAEDLDFQISDALVDDAIKSGEFYYLGQKLDGTKQYFNGEAPDAYFDFDRLERLSRSLGLPGISTYKKEQKREMLAYFIRQELMNSAIVSDEEAKLVFVASNTTVSAEFVKFKVSDFRNALKLTEAEIQQYASSHEDDLKNEWDKVKAKWESEKPRIQARIIKIAKLPPTPTAPVAPAPAEEPTEETAAEGEPPVVEATPPAAAVDEARVAIDEARAQILAGADFASVAKEKSSDTSSSLGGAIGWRSAVAIGYGTEVVKASKDLKIGTVSEVIETDRAYLLLLIENRSEKGLTFDQKKFDLAKTLAPKVIAQERAKAAAENALARAKTTPLNELFEKASAAPMDLNGLPPELLKQLSPEQLQQLMQGAQVPGSKSGAVVNYGRIQLAQTGAPTPSAAPREFIEATPKEVKVVPPVKKKVAEPETDDEIADPMPTEIPTEIDVVDYGVKAPGLQQVNATTRNGSFIAGVGNSKSLVMDLFGVLAVGSLAPTVYETSATGGDVDGYVVIQLTDRSEADMEKFKEEAGDLKAALENAKGMQMVESWIHEKCLAMKNAGEINPNYALLQRGTDAEIPYVPCE